MSRGRPTRGWTAAVGSIVVTLCSFFMHILIAGGFSVHGLLYQAAAPHWPYNPLVVWCFSIQQALSLLTGIFAGIFAGALIEHFSSRTVGMIGGALLSTGHIAAAFTPHFPLFVICYGILAGIGFGLIQLPAIVIVQQHFRKHRALAIGMATAGAGIGSFFWPALVEMWLEEYGLRGTVLLMGALFLHGIPFSALFLPPLEPPTLLEQTVPSEMENQHLDFMGSLSILKATSMVDLKSEHSYRTSQYQTETFSLFSHNKSKPLQVQNTNFNSYTGSYCEVNRNHTNRFLDQRSQEHKSLQNLHLYLETSPKKDKLLPLHFQNLKLLYETKSLINISESSSSCDDKDAQLHKSQCFSMNSTVDMNTSQHSLDLETNQNNSNSKYGNSLEVHPFEVHDSSSEPMEIQVGLAPSTIPIISDSYDNQKYSHIHQKMLHIMDFLGLTLLSNWKVWFLLIGFFFQTLGMLAPPFFLPAKFSTTMDRAAVALLVGIIGITDTIGRMLFGAIGSLSGASPLIMFSLLSALAGASSIASTFIGETFAIMATYSSFYGFFMGGMTCNQSMVVVQLLGIDRLAKAYGLYMLFGGLGFFFSNPLLMWVYDLSGDYDTSFYVAGSFQLLNTLLYVIIALFHKRTKEHTDIMDTH